MLDNRVKEMKHFCDNNGVSCIGCQHVKLCQSFTRCNESHKTPCNYSAEYILQELKKYSCLRESFDKSEWTNKGGKYKNTGRDKFSKFYNYLKNTKCRKHGLVMKQDWKEYQTFMEWLMDNYKGERYILIKSGTAYIDENAIIFTNVKSGVKG